MDAREIIRPAHQKSKLLFLTAKQVDSHETNDFRPESDVDVLVTFQNEAPWGLFEFVEMIEELREILGRNVDLIEKEALRNPFRRREILSHLPLEVADFD
jgi:predicted nucleotidyltransferase